MPNIKCERRKKMSNEKVGKWKNEGGVVGGEGAMIGNSRMEGPITPPQFSTFTVKWKSGGGALGTPGLSNKRFSKLEESSLILLQIFLQTLPSGPFFLLVMSSLGRLLRTFKNKPLKVFWRFLEELLIRYFYNILHSNSTRLISGLRFYMESFQI